MYVQMPIVEDFVLPLDISINYKSNLVSQGAGSFASFYAIIYSHYQGRTIETLCPINFDLISDWKTASLVVGEVLGQIRGYALTITVLR